MALAFESRLEEELPWFPIMLFKVTFLRGACGDVVICWVSTQNILGSSKTNVSNSTLKNWNKTNGNETKKEQKNQTGVQLQTLGAKRERMVEAPYIRVA